MSTIMRYKKEDGTWTGLPTIKGEKGDPGEKGEKGDPGEKGEPGATYDDTEIKKDIKALQEELLGVDALIGEVD